jgi:ABC-type nitrate/sulfonate/bicarbonate transport system substrate-binding protein
MPTSNIARRHVLAGSAGLVLDMPFGRRAAAADTALTFQLSWIKSIQYGGFFAGIETGAYAQQGVAATFSSGGPNMDSVANVAAGRAQLGDRPIGPLILARDKGIPIKVIATVFQRSPLAVMSLAATPIRTVKQMEGKTVAVATSNRPLVMNMLRDAGMDPLSVNIVPSSPDPSALVSGQIDAYVGYSTNQGVMLQTRGVEIFALNAHELGIPETAGTIYGQEDFLASNRDLVVRFLRASLTGWRWALDHKDETATLMVQKYGAPGLDFAAQRTELAASEPFITGNPKGLLAIDPALYDRIIALYRKVGMVNSPMTAAELCDPSYITAALAA